jgi:hypothetical protein
LAGLLSLVQLPTKDRRSCPDRLAPLLLDEDLPSKTVPAPPATLAEDPMQLPLIPMDEEDEFREFSEFLKRSSEAAKRVLTVRSSGPVRVSGPARVVVAGSRSPENVSPVQRLRNLFPRYLVPGWAASVALTLLSTLAIGLFFLVRSGGTTDQVAPVMVTNALSAGGRAPDSTVGLALTKPNPLAAEERELETNLRIAEAVVWQPALDFSPEMLWRSARKVDAVRNSISLYRIGAWRQIDSALRDSSDLLESFEESIRVDDVLNLVQSAIGLLDSLITTFRVNGDVLVFSDPTSAARYSWLRNRADSLLNTPVEADSLHPMRAPRRVVGRLLETLPTALVQP